MTLSIFQLLNRLHRHCTHEGDLFHSHILSLSLSIWLFFFLSLSLFPVVALSHTDTNSMCSTRTLTLYSSNLCLQRGALEKAPLCSALFHKERNLISTLISINRFVLANACGTIIIHRFSGTLAKTNKGSRPQTNQGRVYPPLALLWHLRIIHYETICDRFFNSYLRLRKA